MYRLHRKGLIVMIGTKNEKAITTTRGQNKLVNLAICYEIHGVLSAYLYS
jgi:hypothetical protein